MATITQKVSRSFHEGCIFCQHWVIQNTVTAKFKRSSVLGMLFLKTFWAQFMKKESNWGTNTWTQFTKFQGPFKVSPWILTWNPFTPFSIYTLSELFSIKKKTLVIIGNIITKKMITAQQTQDWTWDQMNEPMNMFFAHLQHPCPVCVKIEIS